MKLGSPIPVVWRGVVYLLDKKGWKRIIMNTSLVQYFGFFKAKLA